MCLRHVCHVSILCVVGSRPKSGSFSSSGRSESSAGGAGGVSSGNETEEGEVKARHLLVANHGSNGQRVLVKIRPPQLPARQQREASCSTDGRQSSDDDDDDDDDGDEESEEESSEYASSPDSASNAEVIDQSATPKSSRRRHGDNLNSDDDGTPKRKRSKSDVDGGKMPSGDGAEMRKDVVNKDADLMNTMLDTDIPGMNEAGEPTPAEQEHASSSTSLRDNIPVSQVSHFFCM